MKSVLQSLRSTFKTGKKGKMSKFVDEVSPQPKTEVTHHQVCDLDENFQCRVCQDIGEPDQEVCIPCECIGSIKYVHSNCLKEWIRQKQSLECEICHKPYKNKWKIWAYENKIIPVPGEASQAQQKESVWVKLIPLLFFTFFFFGLIVFLLNKKVIHDHNKYYDLVLIFRFGIYIFLALLVVLSCMQLKNGGSFEKREEEAIKELKTKIARFVRD